MDVLDPDFEPLSEWNQDEAVLDFSGALSYTHPGRSLLDSGGLSVPVDLAYRRLYVWVEPKIAWLAAPASRIGDFIIEGKIQLTLGGRVVQEIPANVGQDILGTLLTTKSLVGIADPTTGTSSGGTLATGNTPFAEDGRKIIFGKKFTSGTDHTNLAAQRALCRCDRVQFTYDRVSSLVGDLYVVGIRVFVGVQSSNHSF